MRYKNVEVEIKAYGTDNYVCFIDGEAVFSGSDCVELEKSAEKYIDDTIEQEHNLFKTWCEVEGVKPSDASSLCTFMNESEVRLLCNNRLSYK